MSLVERRIGLLFAVFVLALSVALARAAWLQGVRGGELSASAQSQQTETTVLPARRGKILDRKGRPLAVSEEAATVFATPYLIKDPERTARKLAPILDQPVDELSAKLSADSGFEYLSRQADLVVADKVQKLGIEGLDTSPDARRAHPQGDLAAQIVGAVGIDGQGLTGLEASHDDILGGSDGEIEVVHDALGKQISRDVVTDAKAGADLRLTLDARIQARAEESLRRIGRDYQPDGAVALVMDPRSGEILALANWPAPDLGDIGEASEAQLLERGGGFTYEPGSTFKAFTVSAALEEGLVEPDTAFDLAPTIQVADREISESHPRGPVTLTVADILAQSSNVGAVTIGLEIGGELFDSWIHRFGFGKQTGLDLAGEERGILPALEDYSGSTMGNLPIGQGLAVTPIQMAAAYSAIANGGKLVTPRIVSREGQDASGASRRVISTKTARQVRQMLEGVLAPGGTASEVKVPGYVLAGKTGTAQKAVDGGYSDTEFVASFVGFAPASRPELLAVVAVDVPKGDHYGGSVAAPAFGEIASYALPYLGVEPG